MAWAASLPSSVDLASLLGAGFFSAAFSLGVSFVAASSFLGSALAGSAADGLSVFDADSVGGSAAFSEASSAGSGGRSRRQCQTRASDEQKGRSERTRGALSGLNHVEVLADGDGVLLGGEQLEDLAREGGVDRNVDLATSKARDVSKSGSQMSTMWIRLPNGASGTDLVGLDGAEEDEMSRWGGARPELHQPGPAIGLPEPEDLIRHSRNLLVSLDVVSDGLVELLERALGDGLGLRASRRARAS